MDDRSVRLDHRKACRKHRESFLPTATRVGGLQKLVGSVLTAEKHVGGVEITIRPPQSL